MSEDSLDSVSLDSMVAGLDNSPGLIPRGGAAVKAVLALFLIFIFVVSDVFMNNVLSGFSGAMRGRTTTPFGTVIQGIFHVLFFILALHLISKDII